MNRDQITYSTREAARLAGVTPRQLQHWDETGLVSPERSRGALDCQAVNRRYTEHDIERIRLVSRMRERGLGIKAMRRVLRSVSIASDFPGRRRDWMTLFGRRCRFFSSPQDLITYAAAVPGGVLTFSIPHDEA